MLKINKIHQGDCLELMKQIHLCKNCKYKDNGWKDSPCNKCKKTFIDQWEPSWCGDCGYPFDKCCCKGEKE